MDNIIHRPCNESNQKTNVMRGAGASNYDATLANDPDGVYGACEEPLSDSDNEAGDDGAHTVYESRVAKAAATALAKAASVASAAAAAAAAVGGSSTDVSYHSEALQGSSAASRRVDDSDTDVGTDTGIPTSAARNEENAENCDT